ncbi:hypothetical protein RBI65_16030 [Acinetobacter baumannii]|uniref:hypothetical protein n=1 Tax=Acinetobacter baumannii TaxID=470 RepID=UPI00259D4530|nr:hypothetical protein [Acinetobacter baumannii]EKV6547119.1 hypothetical protein [Acinetobacter baumannii]ELB0409584.1 hypothetical protein [Acinetobacter baumannii]MDQ2466059.1 hypothetical protein [Acinetobacter baumannii]
MGEFKVGEKVECRYKSGVATFISYGSFSKGNSFIRFEGHEDSTMVLTHHLTRIDTKQIEDIGDDEHLENHISPNCKTIGEQS